MSSTNHDRPTAGELVPVKFSRLTRRGVLLGLSLTQLITLAIGGATLIGAFYAGGGMLLAYTAPIWVLAAALTWIPIAGRPIVEWLPIACWWLWRTTGGQLLYRRRIVVPRPVGTLALPGDMARLREYTDPDTSAGMIHDPHAATLTVVCEVTHPAFVLLDPGEQERRVTLLGPRPRHRLPLRADRDPASPRTHPPRLRHRTGRMVGHPRHPGRIMGGRHLRRTHRPRRTRRRTPRHHALAVSLDMKTAARQIRTAGGGIRGAAAVLRQEMNTLVAALRSADLVAVGMAHPRADRGDAALGLRPGHRRHPGTPRPARPVPRDRRAGRGHRDLGPAAHRLRPPRGALDQRVAPVAGVSGVPVAGAAVHRHPAVVLADLHPDALRPGRPRHPQEEGRAHLRPGPAREDRPDRRRLPDRRVPRRAPARSRPHRRPRHPPLHRPHRRLRTHRRGTRRRRRRHRASRDPSLLRDPAPRRPASRRVHRRRAPALPAGSEFSLTRLELYRRPSSTTHYPSTGRRWTVERRPAEDGRGRTRRQVS